MTRPGQGSQPLPSVSLSAQPGPMGDCLKRFSQCDTITLSAQPSCCSQEVKGAGLHLRSFAPFVIPRRRGVEIQYFGHGHAYGHGHEDQKGADEPRFFCIIASFGGGVGIGIDPACNVGNECGQTKGISKTKGETEQISFFFSFPFPSPFPFPFPKGRVEISGTGARPGPSWIPAY